MEVRIKYCKPCGYLKRAEQLAERLRRECEANVTLEPGNFGVFKVWVDGTLVFDKRQTGGLLGKLGFGPIPSDDELITKIRGEKVTES